MTGILGLLWFDLRNIRKEREQLTDLVRGSEEAAKKLAIQVAKEVDDKYMSKDYHSLICQNVTLTMERSFRVMLKDAVDEIKKEIRENGKG